MQLSTLLAIVGLTAPTTVLGSPVSPEPRDVAAAAPSSDVEHLSKRDCYGGGLKIGASKEAIRGFIYRFCDETAADHYQPQQLTDVCYPTGHDGKSKTYVQISFKREGGQGQGLSNAACKSYLQSQLGCEYGGVNSKDGWRYKECRYGEI